MHVWAASVEFWDSHNKCMNLGARSESGLERVREWGKGQIWWNYIVGIYEIVNDENIKLINKWRDK